MNEGQLTGTIIKVLEPRKGTSRNTGKDYYVGEFVLETEEEYPTKVHFTIFGEDKVRGYDLHEGDFVQVAFYVNSREYNERWYTDIRVRNIVKTAPGQMAGPQMPGSMPGSIPSSIPSYSRPVQSGYAPQAPQGMPQYGQQPQQPYSPQQDGGNAGGVDDLPF